MATYTTAEWKDRISEDPTKRSLTIVSDSSSTLSTNTVLTATVARADTATQEGTAFNATNMNSLESRINSAMNTCLVYSYLGNINASSGIYLPSTTRDYPLLEIFYGDTAKKDGVHSRKIYIGNYNSNNYVSLDSISCGIGSSNNSFYFKTAVYNIHNEGNQVRFQRLTDRSKRLVYENGSFHVEQYQIIDLNIYYVIGYKT